MADPQIGQVIQPIVDARNGPGKAVDIKDMAHPARALEPVGIQIARQIQMLQILRSCGPGLRQQVAQLRADRREIREVAVKPPRHRPQIGALRSIHNCRIIPS